MLWEQVIFLGTSCPWLVPVSAILLALFWNYLLSLKAIDIITDNNLRLSLKIQIYVTG